MACNTDIRRGLYGIGERSAGGTRVVVETGVGCQGWGCGGVGVGC